VFVCVCVCVCVCTDAHMYFRMTLGDGGPGGISAPTTIYGQYSTEDPNNQNYDDTKSSDLKNEELNV